EVFESTCAACHQPDNPRFKMGRSRKNHRQIGIDVAGADFHRFNVTEQRHIIHEGIFGVAQRFDDLHNNHAAF
ncbi:MAG: hypothetical protein DYH06_11550, partial [Acidobacteria bacterium ACB2]|nr:hypothetical protein [Acidobacteria bacterium ACB2]